MNGHQIAEGRKKMRLSQTEFAEKLGVSRGSIHAWESGKGEPTRNHRRALANLLGLDDDSVALSSELPATSHAAGGHDVVPVFRTTMNNKGTLPWSFRVTGEVVDMVNSPRQLRHRKDLRAFQVPNDHMSPRYLPGEMVWMSMGRMAIEGDFVVVMRKSHNGNDTDSEEAALGRLIKLAPHYIEIEQYKPAKIYKIQRKDIAEIWRIVPAAEFG